MVLSPLFHWDLELNGPSNGEKIGIASVAAALTQAYKIVL
jgi:hypothetical protein